jgi:hypothetical protein
MGQLLCTAGSSGTAMKNKDRRTGIAMSTNPQLSKCFHLHFLPNVLLTCGGYIDGLL